MHNDVYTSYATGNLEIDIARHAKLRNGNPATPKVKQESYGS